jgi:lysophospholipid acyltransferase (LPLAT)-like uncharacterized protein
MSGGSGAREFGILRMLAGLKAGTGVIIPHPFATVRVIFGVPIRIAETQTPEEFEAERMRLQNAVMALVEER